MTRRVGRSPATRRRAGRRFACWTGVTSICKLGCGRARGRRGGAQAGGSWRVVPLVKPLKSGCCGTCGLRRVNRTRARSVRHGRSARRDARRSATSRAGAGVSGASSGLETIGLHESRHTAATWLDHAGVSPKVASTLMGHKTPEYQPERRRSRCGATRTRCRASWSGHGISSTAFLVLSGLASSRRAEQVRTVPRPISAPRGVAIPRRASSGRSFKTGRRP